MVNNGRYFFQRAITIVVGASIALLLINKHSFGSEKPTSAQIRISRDFGKIPANFWGIKETRFYIDISGLQEVNTIPAIIDSTVASLADTVLRRHIVKGTCDIGSIVPMGNYMFVFTIIKRSFLTTYKAELKIVVNADNSMLGIWATGLSVETWKHRSCLLVAENAMKTFLKNLPNSYYIGKQTIKNNITQILR